jgi:hypothetical protein
LGQACFKVVITEGTSQIPDAYSLVTAGRGTGRNRKSLLKPSLSM